MKADSRTKKYTTANISGVCDLAMLQDGPHMSVVPAEKQVCAAVPWDLADKIAEREKRLRQNCMSPGVLESWI